MHEVSPVGFAAWSAKDHDCLQFAPNSPKLIRRAQPSAGQISQRGLEEKRRTRAGSGTIAMNVMG